MPIRTMLSGRPTSASAPVRWLQRSCACGRSPGVDGECAECRARRPGGSVDGSVATAPPVVHDALRSSGQSLDRVTRASMEQSFGHDFSQVRVHADATAAESARSVGANAFTVGSDVVFGSGQYRPASAEGRRLIAHELAHVVQQGSRRIGRTDETIAVRGYDSHEAAARQVARSLDGGMVASHASVGPTVQRDDAPKIAGCSGVDLFAELALPGVLPNSYLHGKSVMEKGKWKDALKTAKVGKCEALGSFKGVKLAWDLGNPKLGRKFLIDLNKNDIKFDINLHVLHSASPCHPCFQGTAAYSFDVSISRKIGGTTETGKTKAPIIGTATTEKCKGSQGCAIDEKLPISLWVGDDEIDGTISGEVHVTGATYSG